MRCVESFGIPLKRESRARLQLQLVTGSGRSLLLLLLSRHPHRNTHLLNSPVQPGVKEREKKKIETGNPGSSFPRKPWTDTPTEGDARWCMFASAFFLSLSLSLSMTQQLLSSTRESEKDARTTTATTPVVCCASNVFPTAACVFNFPEEESRCDACHARYFFFVVSYDVYS